MRSPIFAAIAAASLLTATSALACAGPTIGDVGVSAKLTHENGAPMTTPVTVTLIYRPGGVADYSSPTSPCLRVGFIGAGPTGVRYSDFGQNFEVAVAGDGKVTVMRRGSTFTGMAAKL